MSLIRSSLIQWIKQGSIAVEHIDEALNHTQIHPNKASWLQFIDHLLLWFGSLAIAIASIFLVAFNWDDLSRFTHYALLEVSALVCIIAYCLYHQNRVVSQVSLIMAALFIGALLALVGQTYQTGADPWQLFFYWAIFITAWAIIARSESLWVIWLILLNTSIITYQNTFGMPFGSSLPSEITAFLDHQQQFVFVLFVFNTLCLFAWELIAHHVQWKTSDWGVRVPAIASGVAITELTQFGIFDGGSAFFVCLWLVWAVVFLFSYRKLRPDLFMLAGANLSIIVVITSFMANLLIELESLDGLLLLALTVIGLGAASAIWLKKVHMEMKS
ncbi:DUF2157 domain-containing protein [Shewanella gelidii]|nr:DUF2157 domain-containing protein [Shewanella gelidii]MCL1098145.1 DUF2157 domain-containing protein [Shewanella gelidii]